MEMTCGPDRGEASLKSASVPLLTVTRSGESDLEHAGFACLVDADGKCRWSLGDPHAMAFFRSSAKPLQALAMVECGAADAAGLDDADLAIICGSHPGGTKQAELVRSLLAKSGLGPESLGCGEGLADQCSGKHAGMLTACAHLRLPLHDYLAPDHPWQQRMFSTLCRYCAVNAQDTRQALDGCSAPTFSLPLYNMALGFARLARDAVSPGPAARLLRAMAVHPGVHTGEPDLRPFRLAKTSVETGTGSAAPRSSLAGTLGAELITKGGANGLLCAALPGLGLGFALKVVDGSPLPLWPVFTRALEQAGLIDAGTVKAMRAALWPRIETRRGVEAGGLLLQF
ncbi:MAG: asparaginase [Fibrobacteria bacterium]